MTPDSLARIEKIFHAALARPVVDRPSFLSEACAGDDDLRREIESLLAYEASPDSLLEKPAWQIVSSSDSATGLSPGTQLGPYRIQAQIGQGGMGQVYRAVDTRLDRLVAIKVAHHQFSNHFEREARAISSLNHPNICTLYDVGPNYLVMELVEGETLGARLKQGRMKIAEVVRYGAQVADALAAAHAKGILHRDLKPANIMLTKTGVKVLDFGIAKVTSPEETLTASGLVVGTPAYMAPEQRCGKTCDSRTDIYAIGLVLHEMAMGKKPLGGQPPSMQGLAPQFAHVVERCLEPEPEERWQSASDIRRELEWVGKGILTPPKPRQRPSWRWPIAISFVLVGLALAWVIKYIWPAAHGRSYRLTIKAPPGTELRIDNGAAISPDGRLVAFVAKSAGIEKLWIRRLDSMVARELPGTDGAAFPFWSPDSRSVGFFATAKLQRIELAGGRPTTICNVGLGRGGTWNEEGLILFNAVNDGPLLQISANGGKPVPVTVVDASNHENSHRWPQFLPGGRRYLYFIRSENSGVYMGSLDRPQEKKRLVSSPTNAVYAHAGGYTGGHLFWVHDGTLLAQRFNPNQGYLSGEILTVAESVAAGGATKLGVVSVSNDRTLLYGGSAVVYYQLNWYGRDGRRLGGVSQPDYYESPRISPDGKRVAVGKGGNVWQIEFTRGIPAVVSLSEGLDPVWSPDGERIAYWKGAPPNIFARSANGVGPEERLVESRDSLFMMDWSPDGKSLLYVLSSNDLSMKTQIDLWIMPLARDRKAFPFLTTPFREGRGQFSPDGKWIAYTSDESRKYEVYVQSFPPSGFKRQVSAKGGDWARWRKDGGEMFYVAPDKTLMSVPIRTVSGSLEFGDPTALFKIPVIFSVSGDRAPFSYDVAPDGGRFLAMAPSDAHEAPDLTVIVNWQGESFRDKN